MRVSIVTISYNQADYLERCIQSVVSQDYDDIEYIIVDPGSNDGSRDIIESYESQISVRVFQPDDGPADGLNKGFSYATGGIFFYLNADDELLPGAVKAAVSEFNKNPNIDILIGHGFRVDSKNKPLRPIFSGSWTLYNYATGSAKAIQQSTFFSREAFQRAGGFNRGNSTCWDGELLLDMVRAGATVQVSNNFFGLFRIHAQGITGSGRSIDKYREDKKRTTRKILGRDLTLRDKLSAYLVRFKFRVRLILTYSVYRNTHKAKRAILSDKKWQSA